MPLKHPRGTTGYEIPSRDAKYYKATPGQTAIIRPRQGRPKRSIVLTTKRAGAQKANLRKRRTLERVVKPTHVSKNRPEEPPIRRRDE